MSPRKFLRSRMAPESVQSHLHGQEESYEDRRIGCTGYRR